MPNSDSKILRATPYPNKIEILYDPTTGQTELRANPPVGKLTIAGMLTEHVSQLISDWLLTLPTNTSQKNVDYGKVDE